MPRSKYRKTNVQRRRTHVRNDTLPAPASDLPVPTEKKPARPARETETVVEKEVWSTQNAYGINVSTQGRVQLPSGHITRGSTPSSATRRYARVEIADPGCPDATVTVAVHRLVLQTFTETKELQSAHDNGWIVNHRNNDPSDNRLANLEWVTVKGNADHYHQEIYPAQRRKEFIDALLEGRSARRIWIVDPKGVVRGVQRRVNVWNAGDRDWLMQEGLWKEVEAHME